MFQTRVPSLLQGKGVVTGVMLEQNISRAFHCPNSLACPGGVLSDIESEKDRRMCVDGGQAALVRQQAVIHSSAQIEQSTSYCIFWCCYAPRCPPIMKSCRLSCNMKSTTLTHDSCHNQRGWVLRGVFVASCFTLPHRWCILLPPPCFTFL